MDGDARSPRAAAASIDPRTQSQYWLTFDPCGDIGRCSEQLAEMLGRSASELEGLAVTSILERLPLRRETPGANIGTLMMSYVGGRWPLELMLGERWWLPVEALVRSLHVGDGPVFIVELVPRSEAGIGEAGSDRAHACR